MTEYFRPRYCVSAVPGYRITRSLSPGGSHPPGICYLVIDRLHDCVVAKYASEDVRGANRHRTREHVRDLAYADCAESEARWEAFLADLDARKAEMTT